MMMFLGKFLGAFLNSTGGDYFGRRRMYLVMVLGMTATGVGLIFVSNLTTLMVLRFLTGATTTGAYLPAYVIPLEMQGPSYRRMTGLVTRTMSTIMVLLGGLCAFLLRDWRSYQACVLSPCIVILVGYFFVPESPRWLVSKGRLDEAQKIVDAMAKTNGVSIAPKLSSAMFDKKDNSQNRGTRVTPLQLFRVPRLFVRYNLLYLSWILIVLCNYGLSYNVTNMSGDIFLNYTVLNLVEFISLFLFFFLIERIGRRHFLLASIGTGGVVCLAAILPTVLGGSDWIFRALSFFGRMCVSAGFVAIYVLSPELFPTVLRSFGLGSCSMMSRFGGLASPYIADLNTYVSGMWGPALPQMVFGVAGLLTAVMIFFLPETRGRNLPETVRDAELFGRIPDDDLAFSTEAEILPMAKNEENMFASNGSEKHTI
ncbi:organic cation transporter protein-like isoform X2 [Littorina saxatilis]|uniref:Major facilitator superfamily (MFS) profile domain-containing protein n=1 Tax=Littorina saxatilis TaxID=31220 RepID=A0AAN9GHW6_9CAEN